MDKRFKDTVMVKNTRLNEVSMVNFASNADAVITGTKGKDTVIGVISSNTPDDYNTIIDNQTMKFRASKNPTPVLWSHEKLQIPVGHVSKIWQYREKGVPKTGIEMKLDTEGDPMAKTLFRKVERGEVTMLSGGFEVVGKDNIQVLDNKNLTNQY